MMLIDSGITRSWFKLLLCMGHALLGGPALLFRRQEAACDVSEKPINYIGGHYKVNDIAWGENAINQTSNV